MHAGTAQTRHQERSPRMGACFGAGWKTQNEVLGQCMRVGVQRHAGEWARRATVAPSADGGTGSEGQREARRAGGIHTWDTKRMALLGQRRGDKGAEWLDKMK